MAAKKRGLGRGLDALLGPAHSDTASLEEAQVSKPSGPVDGELRTLGVEQLQRGKYQPRVDMHTDSLDDLADSIRAQGVVQPIVVRPLKNHGHYEIIAGERRWRAAQLAGLKDIPVVVRDIDDRAAIAMSIIENIQRENLNPLEEAQALQRLIDEFDMTHQQAAEAVGRSRAMVSNLLRLLELGDVANAMVRRGELEMGHARALLALNGSDQAEAARKVVARNLSVRATERLVQTWQSDAESVKKSPITRRDPNLVRLEQDLSEKIGAPAQINCNDKGRGKLTISYNSLDELDGILEHIR